MLAKEENMDHFFLLFTLFVVKIALKPTSRDHYTREQRKEGQYCVSMSSITDMVHKTPAKGLCLLSNSLSEIVIDSNNEGVCIKNRRKNRFITHTSLKTTKFRKM